MGALERTQQCQLTQPVGMGAQYGLDRLGKAFEQFVQWLLFRVRWFRSCGGLHAHYYELADRIMQTPATG